ncbi:hypothetical protein FJ364_00760 [Candidatus Dependentiae bacterium]|nr:hypothetical protein [Candidatus Dependentiae bacterium]
MNLHLFTVRLKFILCLFLIISACARKNKRVYDFLDTTELKINRVTLPYVTRFYVRYDHIKKKCCLSWQPLSNDIIPANLSFIGYKIYCWTRSGFIPREVFLHLSVNTHQCIITNAVYLTDGQIFSIVPLFKNELQAEVAGIHTPVKLRI